MAPKAPEQVVDVARRIVSARADEVAHYAQIYPLLLGEIPDIMSAWDKSIDQLPWSDLEASSRQNNLVSVITRVIDCAMSSASREERVNALIQAAANHGASRREQGGIKVEDLFTEYDRLRGATWNQLKSITEDPTIYDAIFVIDGLLSIASRATALGFHRAEMQQKGLWTKQLDELKKTVRS